MASQQTEMAYSLPPQLLLTLQTAAVSMELSLDCILNSCCNNLEYGVPYLSLSGAIFALMF